MIYYNFPYKGPFEYDKSILSILQYCNESEYMRSVIKDKEGNFMSECKKVDEELKKFREENMLEKLRHQLEMME